MSDGLSNPEILPPDAPAAPVSRVVVAARAVECAVLFGVLPATIDLARHGKLLIPGLMVGAVLVTTVLFFDPTFDRRRFFNFAGLRRTLPFMATTLVLGAAFMVGVTIWLSDLEFVNGHVQLWGFLKRNPQFYLVIMCAYPFFSVYPQELMFRTFFFHRYACLFRSPLAMICASAAAFGWAHVMFDNPHVRWDAELAVGLTTMGGILFAWTYHRSQSTAAAWLEHSLFGDWMWTVGLGWLFYAGATRMTG
jgi:hypothetical protein